MKAEIYAIDHIDQVLGSIIARTMANPEDAFTKLLAEYDRPRRLGSVMMGSGVEQATGDPKARRIASVRVHDRTLTCVYQPDETVRWDNGALILLAARARIPDTLRAAMVGKRLRAIVDAWWIPWNAVITEVEGTDQEVILTCNGWTETVETTRLRVTKKV